MRLSIKNDTKVGKFLRSKGFDKTLEFAEKLGIPGAGALDALKDAVIGNNPLDRPLNDAEKVEFQQAHEMDLKQLDLVLKDVQDARSKEVLLNINQNSSWLSKNVGPIIALVLVSLLIALFVLVLVGKINSHDNITFLVINSTQSIVLVIVGYYFGSSKTNTDNVQTMRNILNK